METKKLTKEEFLEKLKTDRDFNNRYGRKHITEGKMVLPPCHYGFQVYTRELSFEERYEIPIKYITEDKLHLLFKRATNENLDELGVPKRSISLMANIRSNDVPLGLPFNIASYALLLEIIGKMVNMIPDELIINIGDAHIYLNQIEGVKEQIGRKYTHEERHEMLKTAMGDFYQTTVKEQVPFGGGLSEYYESYKIPTHTREPYPLPKLIHGKTDAFYKTLSEDLSLFGHLDPYNFKIENYQSHPSIKMPLSN